MKKPMLQQYTTLVNFLGQVLGPDYEIALHDFSDKSNSIVAIANGHVSGREKGAPMTSLALAMISDKRYLNKDYHVNYNSMTSDNKILRSSTMYIKDEAGKPVGMLCINFDDSRYQELGTKLFQLCHPDQFVEQNLEIRGRTIETDNLQMDDDAELFPNSISSIMENVIHDVIKQDSVAAERFTKEEKIRIVRLLEEQGIFLMKGAVNYVAESLHSSPASIYRYLKK